MFASAPKWMASIALIVLGLLGACIVDAQGSKPLDYPDSPDGLRDFLEHIATLPGSDSQESVQPTADLAIPNSESWFEQTFGVTAGKKINNSYLYSHAALDLRLVGGIEQFSKQSDVTVSVWRIETANEDFVDIGDVQLFETMKHPVPFYRANVIDNKTGRKLLLEGYFFYVRGAFRHVGGVGSIQHPINDVTAEPLVKLDDQGNMIGPGLPPLGPLFRIRVSGEDMEKRLIHRADPIYPEEAVKARAEGPVQVRAIINDDGSVGNLQLIIGRPTLLRAAMETVRKWRYKPVLVDGKAVQVDTTVTVVFKLPALN